MAVGDISPATDWKHALQGIDHVVHLAARVHVMRDTAVDPMAEFRRANVDSSLQLARQAMAAGVSRFVYISSIKVNGDSSAAGHPFRASDTPQPVDPYGRSKYEAEQALRALTTGTRMELVVVRPPLVYGPGVRANFRGMMEWLRRGIPLPFGAVDNCRSLVSLDNLCDVIVTCLRHPAAGGQTFLVSDDDDISISELLRRLGLALGHPARLLSISPTLLRAGLNVLGRPAVAQRLLGSLQVDITHTREVLGWQPPVALDEGLRRAAISFLAESRH